MYKLDASETERLKILLEDNGFEELSKDIAEKQDERKIIIGDLYKMYHCKNHQWSKITKEMFWLHIAYPSDIKTEEEQVETLLNIANMECKCLMCSLPYKFRNVDIKKVIDTIESDYNDSFTLNISFGSNSYDYLRHLLDDKVTESVKKFEEKITSINVQINRAKHGETIENQELNNLFEEENGLQEEYKRFYPGMEELSQLLDSESFKKKRSKKQKV